MNVRTFPFQERGRNFEVRTTPNSDGWEIRVFEDNKPATAIKYAIASEVEIDAKRQSMFDDLVGTWMEHAAQCVRDGTDRLIRDPFPTPWDDHEEK